MPAPSIIRVQITLMFRLPLEPIQDVGECLFKGSQVVSGDKLSELGLQPPLGDSLRGFLNVSMHLSPAQRVRRIEGPRSAFNPLPASEFLYELYKVPCVIHL